MEHLALYVQLTASALTIAGSWFYGNKSRLGPWLGIASQVPWNVIMVSGGLWGLAPVNIMMAVIHVRNLLKWRADAQEADRLRLSREAVQANAVDTAALQEHHHKRPSPKAYEIFAGGELR